MGELDPVIHQATRLRIMALLHRNRQASVTWVQQTLELTPGNLASHVTRLQEAGYVVNWMALTPRGFESWLRITDLGSESFNEYLAKLRGLLDDAPSSAPQKKDAPK